MNEKPRSVWRSPKRFLFGLACLLVLIALFYAEEDWRGKHDWENFKREWEAKGEHFDFASMVPPPVPDDQNFALVVTNHLPMSTVAHGEDLWMTETNGNWQLAKMSDLKNWQNYYRTLAKTTNLFPVSREPQTAAQDVLLALSKYDSAIEDLRQASRLPYSRFPLNYNAEDPNTILLAHVWRVRDCAQVLQLRAVAELQNGQSDQAFANVKLALRLADSVHAEPILIPQAWRVIMMQTMLQPVWEGLAEHKWSDAQLIEIEHELGKLDFLSDYKFTMRSETVLFQGRTFEYLRHHPAHLREYLTQYFNGMGFPSRDITSLPSAPISWLFPIGWFYQNQIHCAHIMLQHYLPVADLNQKTISPARHRGANAALQADAKPLTPYNLVESMLLHSRPYMAKRFAYGQASVDPARVAIALERYRLARGEFPESLDALAPRFIEKIPHDVINGEPLRYHRTGDGQFVLYSVGWNEADDGGVVVNISKEWPKADIEQGDWVWRYPAS